MQAIIKKSKLENKLFSIVSLVILFFYSNFALSKTVELVVESTKTGKVSYHVDGSATTSPKLLDILSDKKDTSGEINVYLDNKLSFKHFENIKGLIDKVGYLKAHYYFFGEEKRMMVEFILINKAIPFDATYK